MKNLLFAGIAATSMLMISPAMAANNSSISKAETGQSTSVGGIFDGRRGRGHGSMPHVGTRPTGHGPGMGGNYRWGHRINGRWFAGHHAPNGWNGYIRPSRGFNLPAYWVQPSYRIVNFPIYGLYAPQTGFGWTRYYDDAVLTDGYGYVHDSRSDIQWERYEGGYAPDGYSEPDFSPAMRTDPSAYDNDGRVSSNSGSPYPHQQVVFQNGTGQQDPRYNAGGPPPGQGYQSRYGFESYERCLNNRGVTGAVVGTVVGAVVGNRAFGRRDSIAKTLAGAGIGALIGRSIEKAVKKCKKYLPRDDAFYYGDGRYPNNNVPSAPPVQQQGGYYQNGWYYPAPTVTTIVVSPAVTTTTTTTEEYYYETVSVPAKKKAVRKWKPAKKKHCGCR